MTRIVAIALGAGLLLACGQPGGDGSSSRRGTVAAAATPDRFHLGRPPQTDEIAAWDLDVNPDGAGLPSGRGSAADGAVVYAAKCASCHGPKGEGIAPNPPLVGREPREGFPFATSGSAVKTVGNYWPYATTVFDYVRRAMPQDKPGSLTPNELYALTAWLLAANEVIAPDMVLDSRSLPQVRMPARDRFVPDDRPLSTTFR